MREIPPSIIMNEAARKALMHECESLNRAARLPTGTHKPPSNPDAVEREVKRLQARQKKLVSKPR